MKKTLYLILLPILFFSACKKNDPNTIETACEGGNFCFSLDNTSMAVTAEWRFISSDHIRIEWQGSDGTNYKNIALDIYGTQSGYYAIQPPSSSMSGSKFQHFINDNGSSQNIQGNSGTVEITEFGNGKVSGRFSIQAKDAINGVEHSITEGKFVDVPQY